MMKNLCVFTVFAALLFVFVGFDAPAMAQECTTIQDGVLVDESGQPLSTGFDDWGYNYQAQLFLGSYCDAYRGAQWCQPFAENNLEMKWSQEWLSNQDCDGDGQLDRHFGFNSYIGSGAWLTNHESGVYIDIEGKIRRWYHFVKIIAVPEASWLSASGVWYVDDGSFEPHEIGPAIWGEFAIIENKYFDTGTHQHAVFYHSPVSPGLGYYGPHNNRSKR